MMTFYNEVKTQQPP